MGNKFVELCNFKYGAKINGVTFLLELGDIGVMSYGKCYRLWVLINGNKTYVAHFVIRDDGYKCYEKSVDKKLWSTMNEIIAKAEEVATKYSMIL